MVVEVAVEVVEEVCLSGVEALDVVCRGEVCRGEVCPSGAVGALDVVCRGVVHLVAPAGPWGLDGVCHRGPPQPRGLPNKPRGATAKMGRICRNRVNLSRFTPTRNTIGTSQLQNQKPVEGSIYRGREETTNTMQQCSVKRCARRGRERHRGRERNKAAAQNQTSTPGPNDASR